MRKRAPGGIVIRLRQSAVSRLRSTVASTLLLFAGLPAVQHASSAEADFRLKWAWSVAGSAIGQKGLAVVDLDADGENEIVASATSGGSSGYWYVLRRQGDEFEQTYTSLPLADGVLGVEVAFEKAASRIVVVGGSILTIYDGASRRELESLPLPPAFYQALAVADIDDDGDLDAVLSDGFDLWFYDLLSGVSTIKYGFGAYDIAVGQVDGDSQLEIALAGNPTGGFILDGSTLAVQWADLRGFGFRVCFGNFDLDGEDEVAASITQWGGLRVQDPGTGDQIWEVGDIEVAAVAAGDLDGDGISELAWAAQQQGDVHILDGTTGAELRTIASASYGVTSIAIGDTDEDGARDIVWGTGWSAPHHLSVARGDATVVAARTLAWAAPFPGVVVGDFAGDGGLQIGAASVGPEGGSGTRTALMFSPEDGTFLGHGGDFYGGGGSQQGSGFAAEQLDGDAALEFCLAGGIAVACFDGADFEEQWRVELADEPYDLAIGEIDGDPLPEVVAGTGGQYVYAFDGQNGWLKWRTPGPETEFPPIDLVLLADVFGNGNMEVVGTAGRFGSPPLTIFAGSSGLVAAGPWNVPTLSMAVLPVAGSPETLLIGGSDGSVAPVDPLTGALGTTVASFSGPVVALGFADFNRDGTLDTVALLEDHFEVEDGETNLVLFVSPFLGYLNPRGDSMVVGDLDGNSVPEILIATGNGLALYEAPLFAIFADGFESGDTGNW